MTEERKFQFIRPPSVFGQVLSVSLSEPKESDFGTYQRILIEVDTPDEPEPFTIMLPMPKGWPNRINDRSTLARWINRAAENDAKFVNLWRNARSIEQALKMLEQKFVEFQREEYDFGGDRKFEYQTPKRLFNSQQEMLQAYAASMGEGGTGEDNALLSSTTASPQNTIPADVLSNARTTWAALTGAFDDATAEEQFKAMSWPVPVDALLEAVKNG